MSSTDTRQWRRADRGRRPRRRPPYREAHGHVLLRRRRERNSESGHSIPSDASAAVRARWQRARPDPMLELSAVRTSCSCETGRYDRATRCTIVMRITRQAALRRCIASCGRAHQPGIESWREYFPGTAHFMTGLGFHAGARARESRRVTPPARSP